MWLLACVAPSEPADSAAPPFYPPDEAGPHGVGATTLTWTDDRGKELVAEVWYPAEPGCSPDEYPELPFVGLACRNAEPVGEGWPLVAFSHGYGGIRYQSIFMTEWLATHGYVVVSPDHAHNTLLDLDEAYDAQVAMERPGDVIRAVDRLAVDLPGLADDTRYGMSGHSFGGWTTLAVSGGVTDLAALRTFCETNDLDLCALDFPEGAEVEDGPDARVVAALPMAPAGWYSFGALDGMPTTLLMGGAKDAAETPEDEILPLYERLPSPKRLSMLADAGHFAFSDICLLGDFVDDCAEAEGGYIEMEVAHEIVRAQAAEFFGYSLGGDTRYLDWLGPVWPEVDWEESP
jgi:predicted dienelactone hydrolase